jgi:hypothetical protein
MPITIAPNRETPITGVDPKLIIHPEEVRIVLDPYNLSAGRIGWNYKTYVEVDGNNQPFDAQLTGRFSASLLTVKDITPGYPGLVGSISGADLSVPTIEDIVKMLLDGFNKQWVQANP